MRTKFVVMAVLVTGSWVQAKQPDEGGSDKEFADSLKRVETEALAVPKPGPAPKPAGQDTVQQEETLEDVLAQIRAAVGKLRSQSAAALSNATVIAFLERRRNSSNGYKFATPPKPIDDFNPAFGSDEMMIGHAVETSCRWLAKGGIRYLLCGDLVFTLEGNNFALTHGDKEVRKWSLTAEQQELFKKDPKTFLKMLDVNLSPK